MIIDNSAMNIRGITRISHPVMHWCKLKPLHLCRNLEKIWSGERVIKVGGTIDLNACFASNSQVAVIPSIGKLPFAVLYSFPRVICLVGCCCC